MSRSDPYGDATVVGGGPAVPQQADATRWSSEAYGDPTYGLFSGPTTGPEPDAEAVTEALPADARTHLVPAQRTEVRGGLFDSYAEFEPPRPRGRSPMVVVGAGGLVAALVVIGAVAFWPRGGPGIGDSGERIAPAADFPTPTGGAPVATLPPPTTVRDTDAGVPTVRSRPTSVVPRTTVSVPPAGEPGLPVPPPPDPGPGVPPPTTTAPPPTTTTAPPPTTTSAPPPVVNPPV